MEAGRRAKSRTHATAPWYERQRRNSHAVVRREEKQQGRKNREINRRPVDPVRLLLIVRAVFAKPTAQFLTRRRDTHPW